MGERGMFSNLTESGQGNLSLSLLVKLRSECTVRFLKMLEMETMLNRMMNLICQHPLVITSVIT